MICSCDGSRGEQHSSQSVARCVCDKAGNNKAQRGGCNARGAVPAEGEGAEEEEEKHWRVHGGVKRGAADLHCA